MRIWVLFIEENEKFRFEEIHFYLPCYRCCANFNVNRQKMHTISLTCDGTSHVSDVPSHVFRYA